MLAAENIWAPKGPQRRQPPPGHGLAEVPHLCGLLTTKGQTAVSGGSSWLSSSLRPVPTPGSARSMTASGPDNPPPYRTLSLGARFDIKCKNQC